MSKREQRRIQELEQEVEWLKRDLAYYRELSDNRLEAIRLIKEAWSIVHPTDIAYMLSTNMERPHLNLYSGIVYSYGRTWGDGTCSTRYSSFERKGYQP